MLHMVSQTRAQYVLFFFSSRRRHTRLQGDWSSDVCSSDLTTTLTRSHLLHNVTRHLSMSKDGKVLAYTSPVFIIRLLFLLTGGTRHPVEEEIGRAHV